MKLQKINEYFYIKRNSSLIFESSLFPNSIWKNKKLKKQMKRKRGHDQHTSKLMNLRKNPLELCNDPQKIKVKQLREGGTFLFSSYVPHFN